MRINRAVSDPREPRTKPPACGTNLRLAREARAKRGPGIAYERHDHHRRHQPHPARDPHRYPFLLVDKVVEIDGTKRGVGVKNVTVNEPFFEGHFPQEPVMPGVLIIEAMAQTSAVIVSLGQNLIDSGALVYFMGIDGAKFRRQGRARRHAPGWTSSPSRGGGKVWRFRARPTGEATSGVSISIASNAN